MCLHESIGVAEDGSGVVVCWDCDEQFVPESKLREKLNEMDLNDGTGHPGDIGYQAAVDEIRETFLGGNIPLE